MRSDSHLAESKVKARVKRLKYLKLWQCARPLNAVQVSARDLELVERLVSGSGHESPQRRLVDFLSRSGTVREPQVLLITMRVMIDPLAEGVEHRLRHDVRAEFGPHFSTHTLILNRAQRFDFLPLSAHYGPHPSFLTCAPIPSNLKAAMLTTHRRLIPPSPCEELTKFKAQEQVLL